MMQIDFIESLMGHIMEATMIPKAQIERAVGPILSMFLAKVLTETLRDDPDLSGEIIMVCPEFPLKKGGNRQSTNLDWLMINPSREMLLFVELKTSDTSVNANQNAIYHQKKGEVHSQGGGFLVRDVQILRDASNESGKYSYILEHRIAPHREMITHCRDARVLYIVPASAQHKITGEIDRVITFGNLAEKISEPYPDAWKVIHRHLSKLDESSQRSRNIRYSTSSMGFDGQNFKGKLDFKSMMDLCEERGNAIVVGFMGGITDLRNSNRNYLENRLYKWDEAQGGVGKKEGRNWIPGNEFYRIVAKKPQIQGSQQTRFDAPKRSQQVYWEGTAKFDEMVALCQEHGDDIVIGFTGGWNAFANTPIEKLRSRSHYKWDYARNMGKKKRSDWLRGKSVLQVLARKR